ncbi:unnamed protein product [Haemonchus placei]|uniref:MFS domain-containing protein n=1 Tax=Haemonchus placei TaxID=6290 RepID=A0A0N4X7D5_HAEPC|nr:unnamed protein product [Haemonchus placei]
MLSQESYVHNLFLGLTCIVPMYLAETSPTNLRGMLGSLHQLLVTIAILVSQILGLPYILGNTDRWPLIFAFTVVPSVLQVITLPVSCLDFNVVGYKRYEVCLGECRDRNVP